MRKFFVRLVINAFALFVAVTLLNGRGIEPQDGSVVSYLLLALIFGVVNAVLRPILTLLGCPVLVLTLGLGVLLINTLLFYLTGWIGASLGSGFQVDGFWPAFFGALIVSIVSMLLNWVLRDELRD